MNPALAGPRKRAPLCHNCLIREQFCPSFDQRSRIFSNVFGGLRNCSQTYCVLEIRLLEFVQKQVTTTIYCAYVVFSPYTFLRRCPGGGGREQWYQPSPWV